MKTIINVVIGIYGLQVPNTKTRVPLEVRNSAFSFGRVFRSLLFTKSWVGSEYEMLNPFARQFRANSKEIKIPEGVSVSLPIRHLLPKRCCRMSDTLLIIQI